MKYVSLHTQQQQQQQQQKKKKKPYKKSRCRILYLHNIYYIFQCNHIILRWI